MIITLTSPFHGLSSSKADPAYYSFFPMGEEEICEGQDMATAQNNDVVQVVNTVQDSVEAYLSRKIFDVDGVEAILARQDHDFLHIWVIINRPNPVVEDRIYDTYLDMLQTLADQPTDLVVLYRADQQLTDLRPSGAHQVSRTPHL